MRKHVIFGVFVLMVLGCAAYGGPKTLVVVELFTSEGCSSCPPAEERLSGIMQDPTSEVFVLPIEWHVDYWDYLGWKDPFGSARATERQYQYAKSLPSSVYTPEMVVNGKIEAPWFGTQADFNSYLKTSASSTRVLDVDFEVLTSTNLNECKIRVKAKSPLSKLKITALLIESGLSSTPKSGENAGVFLKHSNVVRRDQNLSSTSGEVAFEIPPQVKRQNAQIVLLVQDENTKEIVLAKVAGLPNAFKGKVVDKAGRPLAGYLVQACNDQKCIPAKTDSEGRFSFESLSPGTYTLAIGKKLNALKFSVVEGQSQGQEQEIVFE